MLENESFPNPSEDGIWLAKSLKLTKNQTALDVGCGTGVVTLCAKHLFPNAIFTGVDIQAEAIKLAKQNSQLNNFAINWLTEDIINNSITEKYDVVFSNPPFHRTDMGFSSNKNNVAFATNADMVTTWIKNMLELTKPNGSINLIHHSQNTKIIENFSKKYAVEITKLKTSSRKPAKRILVHIKKGKKPSLSKKVISI